MKEVDEELDRLFGNTKPEKFKINIVQTEYGTAYIANSKPSLNEFLISIGSPNVEDVFNEDEIKQLPSEIGIYRCELITHVFRCNHPQDPEEWDMTLTLENIEKINGLEL